MLSFSNMLDLLMDEFTGRCRRRLAFPEILFFARSVVDLFGIDSLSTPLCRMKKNSFEVSGHDIFGLTTKGVLVQDALAVAGFAGSSSV